ncbi:MULTISPECIES: hypothetical protein [unclassified Novosphingobium]|uniref:hypothetical protein n=1 Tax=unclassified Novosphingobium TaxID=2644732 RepID=UPI00135941AB|nr:MULTISPECIES: hypothetical protein [unclassified Novosphingobium]
MKRLAPALALLALAGALASPMEAAARRKGYDGPPGAGTANPSALVAAEIAFARMAREKGQWTAFREYADDDAVMFVPQAVLAKDWLRGRADPSAPVQWQTHQVWMSCDGTVGVTKGGWQQPDGKTGYFTTIWKRQKKGNFRWILDQGDTLAQPLVEPDMLSASVADCDRRHQGPHPEGTIVVEEKSGMVRPKGSGESDDGTLKWTYTVAPDNSRTVAVSMLKGGEQRQVFSLDIAAGER